MASVSVTILVANSKANCDVSVSRIAMGNKLGDASAGQSAA